MVRKLLTTKPGTAIPILKHVWDQLYKIPEMRVLMNKYWSRDSNLVHIMLDIGKYRGRKDDEKLLQCVNKVKQKYNSLRQACRLVDISWTKFHRHTYIKPQQTKPKNYIRKLSEGEIELIQQHFRSDEVSFPLPDKKYYGKRFLRFSLKKCTRMYNLCHETTRQISAAAYHRYKPKTMKLQGKIPFRQSCCEHCQNFENILNEASKYLKDIPSDVGDALDHSMCAYVGYFLKIDCILCICDKCGTSQYKGLILEKNASKVCDRSKHFLVKQWVTKTVRKEDGNAQSFLHWKFE